MTLAVSASNLKEKFVPNFPKAKPRELNWMGRIVEWIRKSQQEGFIYRISVLVFTVLISVALIISIILSPIFIYGFREYILQQERARYDQMHHELVKMAEDFGTQNFLRGRLNPLDAASINVKRSTRKKLIKNLSLNSEEAKKISDRELVKRIAAMNDQFLDQAKLYI